MSLPGLAAAAVLLLAGLVLPTGDSAAAVVTAVYRGETAAGTVPPRKFELRLRTDGTMTWLTDHRNNRAPVTEEGRWYPISAEEFDLIIETRDGKPANPAVIRFVKQGDVLHTTAESAAEFGSAGLELRHVKASTPVAAAPGVGGGPPVGLWRWEGLAPSGQLVVDQPERYTLDLQSGGKALVRADCNRLPATYRMEGRGMSIKLGTGAKSTCAAGSLSDRFLKMLESTVGQRARGENLFLDLPAEAGSLKFVRAR